MNLELKLSPATYSDFIKRFREFGLNSEPGTEVAVTETASQRVFYFFAPNWELRAFRYPGGNRVDLIRYNYPDELRPGLITTETIRNAFIANYPQNIDASLSIILFLTSEAARSNFIYRHFQCILNSRPGSEGNFSLRNATIIVKNFGAVCDFLGYIRDGRFTGYWHPLKYDDYQRVFLATSHQKYQELLTVAKPLCLA